MISELLRSEPQAIEAQSIHASIFTTHQRRVPTRMQSIIPQAEILPTHEVVGTSPTGPTNLWTIRRKQLETLDSHFARQLGYDEFANLCWLSWNWFALLSHHVDNGQDSIFDVGQSFIFGFALTQRAGQF